MAKECSITGKRRMTGGGYSNKTRATQFNPTGKRCRRMNLHKHTITHPTTLKKEKVYLSARGLRTLKKKGVEKTLNQLRKK